MKTKSREEGKILKDGESTFRNGPGGICGGVISKSLFDSDSMAYMMASYMEDDKFVEYKKLKEAKKNEEATKLFDKYAISAI